MTADLEIVEATPDHAFGSWETAVLYVWRGTVTVRAANEITRLHRAVRSRAAKSNGVLLGVVEQHAAPPDGPSRKALAEILSSGAGFFQASALVCEGTGFHASMTRAVATGVAMISRPPFPHQVFAEVEPATDWLERRARVLGVTSYAASAVAERLRALRVAPHR